VRTQSVPESSRTDAAELFDVVGLPALGPVHLAVAFPGARLRACADFPRAALPESGRLASGRGLTVEACHRSCLGEAAELASCCDWGDRPLIEATEEEIGPAVLSPAALNGFSTEQLRDRDAWNRRYAGFDWRPRPCDRRTRLAWVAAADAYGGAGRFAPADFVFIGRRELGDDKAVAIGDSNGCAAGADAEAAQLAALLELIERDATGRWWYGRRRRPLFDIAAIDGAAGMVGWLASRERRTWLFDITTDLAIPVAAAASAEPSGRDVALGFAARLDGHAAALAALTEMAQLEVSLDAARRLGEQAGTWSDWRRTVALPTPPLDAALSLPPERPAWPLPASGLSQALQRCARAGIDLWFADMTHPAIGTPVWRALSTTLCHYKPRFARSRLTMGDDGEPAATATTPADQPLLAI
jgi:ribosomal protein S12 methylthiotransferase accessory factor